MNSAAHPPAPETPGSARSRSLTGRLAWWIAVCVAGGLVVFAGLAYVSALEHERLELGPVDEAVMQEEARGEVMNAMEVAAPICLLLVVTGTVLVTRRMLRPLDQVIRTAKRITTPRDLELRLPVPSPRDEVRELVLALNGLLERLERGFGALDRFAVDASHELRTPLTVMATELEVMLQSSRSSTEWEASARTCLDEIHRLTELVGALLEMGRSERAADGEASTVDVRAVIADMIRTGRERASWRGVYLGAAPGEPSTVPLVRGERAALHTAISSVVDNAIRYTPSGGEVLLWWEVESSGAVTVHVDDSGPGVSAEEAERIFAPYTRGSVGRESSPGFGLGLSIARRICERSGGTVRVARSPSGGARFSLTFPAAVEPWT